MGQGTAHVSIVSCLHPSPELPGRETVARAPAPQRGPGGWYKGTWASDQGWQGPGTNAGLEGAATLAGNVSDQGVKGTLRQVGGRDFSEGAGSWYPWRSTGPAVSAGAVDSKHVLECEGKDLLGAVVTLTSHLSFRKPMSSTYTQGLLLVPPAPPLQYRDRRHPKAAQGLLRPVADHSLEIHAVCQTARKKKSWPSPTGQAPPSKILGKSGAAPLFPFFSQVSPMCPCGHLSSAHGP
ncbi:hypothetical protein H920_00489 [Fukomys damarensis]|uniref:Uncharacterized protein n=1 Tax=Fukomys damarensis TaxID=885580 RepID=A0A091E144_FUKDA|nr:hypothetical protein H920_00489 [Fukomys damarensis]